MEQNWRREEFLCWLTYLRMYLKSKKQFFIYQGWLLHSSRNHYSNIYFSAIGPLDLYCFSFKSAPQTPSYLENMPGFQCALLCMVPDLKANSQLLLLALPCSSSVLQMSGILTGKKELWVNNFQREVSLYICRCCYARKSRLRQRINQKVSVVVKFRGNILTSPSFSYMLF